MKKYKLVNAEGQKGGGLEFMFPMIPSMTGLTMPKYDIQPKIGIMGVPGMPYIGNTTNGLKIGVPLTSDNMKVVIPPKIDMRDPSVFLAIDNSNKKPKELSDKSDVRMTFKEAQPKQSLLMFQPNLPQVPSSYNYSMPVGMVPTQPIVINPSESKARLEITSPDSDDIITISGEQDKVKPVYDGIIANNKVRKAQDEVTLAGKAFNDIKGSIDYNTYKGKTEADLTTDVTNKLLTEEQKKVIIRLQKAKQSLRSAKKSASMDDNDNDIPPSDLVPLTDLFDIKKVTDELKKLKITGYDEKDISVASKKKDNISMMFGMPMPGNYGPTISFT